MSCISVKVKEVNVDCEPMKSDDIIPSLKRYNQGQLFVELKKEENTRQCLDLSTSEDFPQLTQSQCLDLSTSEDCPQLTQSKCLDLSTSKKSQDVCGHSQSVENYEEAFNLSTTESQSLLFSQAETNAA